MGRRFDGCVNELRSNEVGQPVISTIISSYGIHESVAKTEMSSKTFKSRPRSSNSYILMTHPSSLITLIPSVQTPQVVGAGFLQYDTFRHQEFSMCDLHLFGGIFVP